MKKWFITFCALGLISTQVPTADAASIQEEGQGKSVKHDVKVVASQYENLLEDLKNDLSITNIHSLQDLSNQLFGSKENMEKLIASQFKEYNYNYSTPTAPSNGNVVQEEKAVEKTETPKAAVPTAPAKQQEAQAPKAPAAQQPAAPAKEAETAKPAAPAAQSDSVSAFEKQVVELTNAERAKNGLAPLKSYDPLMKVARAKSQDMKTNNYFSHTSPTYGSPFDQMKSAGISYKAAGENIAQGQTTPEAVVQAWMNSEGHRANILNANFTHIGVGYVAEGNYWTQQFIQL
ncbi:MAG TPA: CAP domain-containing protein [Ureibacillus sp.]|nr:CAP domain-containing protein [Ureibacillus sp.]